MNPLWTMTGAELATTLAQPATRPVERVPSAADVKAAKAIIAAHKAATRQPATTFRGFDDFMPAFTFARLACRLANGPRWYLNPSACLKARLPAAWVRWHGLAVSGTSPRDVNFPVARYWEGGVLPIGPEYAPLVEATDSRVVLWKPRKPAPVLELLPVEWDHVADAAD